MENRNLILAHSDFEKLATLVGSASYEAAKLLEEELARAVVVQDEQLPANVVAMNSTVTFQDLDSKKETVVTLVYPHEANIEAKKVSVLAPVGSALIGLQVGQTIQWPMPGGKEANLKVISVERKKEESL